MPKDTTGVVESIRQLKVARSGAIKGRSAALVSLGALIITAPASLCEQLNARSLPARAAQAARLRPDLARCTSRPRPPNLPCAASPARSATWTNTSPSSTTPSHPLVAAAAPRTVRCSAPAPSTPPNCS